MPQNNRKAIIMAGGHGTRLAPITKGLSKHLLPIYNKPMIFYPLSNVIQAGIRDVAMVCNPEDIPLYETLLGDGSQWGLSIQYLKQPEAGGIAQGFLVAEEFIDNHPTMMILGDNVFYGTIMPELFAQANENGQGGTVFAYYVKNPQRYGVVDFDDELNVINIIEKPKDPPSNYAVTGIYFYDETAVERTKSLKASDRGELEITDLNVSYLKDDQLSVVTMNAGVAWLDTGTFNSFLNASNFIEIVEARQGLMIGSPELEAFIHGFIDVQQFKKLVSEYKDGNPYRDALEQFIKLNDI